MKNIIAFLFLISAMCLSNFAQSSLPTLEKIKQLKLLESTREDAVKLLNNEDVGYSDLPKYDLSYFYSEDANITVFYSGGDCSYDDDDWNVSKGKITGISVSPKGSFQLKDLEIDYSKFRKERPRKDYKELYVYHDKKAGIAIWAYGNRIDFIDFTPSEKSFPSLCNRPEVKKYYSSKKYERDPDMRNSTYHNFPPPDVTALDLSRNEIIVCNSPDKDCAGNKISVSAKIYNFINSFTIYDYRVTGGKIVGTGNEVVWDLTEAKAGTYKIIAIADDGSGPTGKWITKTVVVR